AGILIIWDRMFGTYEEEKEEVVYGITTPLRSWNPVWANFSYWGELFAKARRTRRLGDKVRMFLAPPGWHPADLGGFQPPPEVDPASVRRFEFPVTRGLRVYALGQFLAVLGFGAVFLFAQEGFTPLARAGAALFIVASLVVVGGLLEGRRWARPVEVVRLLSAAAVLVGWTILTPR